MCSIEKLQKHLALSLRSNWDTVSDLFSDDPDIVNATIKKFIPEQEYNGIDKICLNLVNFVSNYDVNSLKIHLEEISGEYEIDDKIKEMKMAFMELMFSFETENVVNKIKSFPRENDDKNETELIFLLFNNVLSQKDGDLFRTTIKTFLPDLQTANPVINKIRKSFLSAFNYNKNKLTCTSGVIFVFVADEKNLDLAMRAENFTCHIVFCNTYDIRVIFIDEYGLEYQNWIAYKTKNLLPSGVMVIPKTGAYIFDNNEDVLLEVAKTPATQNLHRAIDVHHIFEQNRVTLTQLLVEDNITELREKIQDIFGYKDEQIYQTEDVENIIMNLIRYVFLSKYKSNFSDCLDKYFLESEIESKRILMQKELLQFLLEVDNGDELKRIMQNLVTQYDNDEKTESELQSEIINLLLSKNNVNFLRKIIQMIPFRKPDEETQRRCERIVDNAFECFHQQRVLKNLGFEFQMCLVLVCNENCTQGLASQNFTWHLISGTSYNGRLILFDNKYRLYSSWQKFLESVNFTKRTIIAPRDGEYYYDENCRIVLDVHIRNLPSNRNVRQRTVLDIQQDFANNSGIGTEITWDYTHKDKSDVLKQKIRYLIPGPELKTKDIDDLFIAAFRTLYLWDGSARLAQILSQLITNKNNNELKIIEKEIKLSIKNFFDENSNLYEEIHKWEEMFLIYLKEDQLRVWLLEILLTESDCDRLRKSIEAVLPTQKGQKAIEEMRETLFQNVWEQRKYTNGHSLTSIIYVLVAQTDETNIQKILSSTEFSCHPVFRTRKCLSKKAYLRNSSLNCCMIYVDEYGRVYQNWKSYIADNVLPSGTMIAPKFGYYTFDSTNRVELKTCSTPASSVTSQVLGSADKTAAWTGFAAAAVPIVSLFVPVAAPLMVAATATGLVTGSYGAVRSGYNLYDRSSHEQSISLDDRQARGSWLGVAAGLVGVGASGATKAMTSAAAMGNEVSLASQVLVNGMNITSIVLSGGGVANGILDIYLKYDDNEEISTLDLLQLSASLVLFTHSVTNFRLASSIVRDTRNGTIQQYRDGLSNRQRKIFNKMYKETIRIKGETQGKLDIIRTTNELPNKQYLNDLYKINKKLNQAKVRPAFGARGEGVVLNNEMPVSTGELRNSVQHNKGPNVLGGVTRGIPESHATISSVNQVRFIYQNSLTKNFDATDASNDTVTSASYKFAFLILNSGVPFNFGKFCKKLCKDFFENISSRTDFENVMCAMAISYTEDVIGFLLKLACDIITSIRPGIQAQIGIFISTESILYKIIDYCLTNYESRCLKFLQNQSEVIKTAVKRHFLSLDPNNNGRKNFCAECDGYYTNYSG